MISSNNPFDGTNRIRFTGYNLSPSVRGHPFAFTVAKIKEKK